MGLLDAFTGPLRSILGVSEAAERDLAHVSPLSETHAIEHRLEEAASAAHRAAESLERHAEAIDTLAESVTPLTESVTALTATINDLLRITAPLSAAEHEVSRLEHLFGRRRGHGQDPEQPPEAPA